MKKIFCLEGEWGLSSSGKLNDKSSMKPLLEFLQQSACLDADFVYRTIATKEELAYYLGKLSSKVYDDYKVVYLACHGEEGTIKLSGRNKVTLEELTEMCNGIRPGKVFHFGSCLTLSADEDRILQFKKAVKANTVSGYTTAVDFIDSSLLDVAYFAEIMNLKRKLCKAPERLNEKYHDLMEQLGFRTF